MSAKCRSSHSANDLPGKIPLDNYASFRHLEPPGHPYTHTPNHPFALLLTREISFDFYRESSLISDSPRGGAAQTILPASDETCKMQTNFLARTKLWLFSRFSRGDWNARGEGGDGVDRRCSNYILKEVNTLEEEAALSFWLDGKKFQVCHAKIIQNLGFRVLTKSN